MTAFSASTATLPVVAPSTTIPLRRAPHLWAGVVLFIAFTAPGWAAAFGAPAAAGAGVIACAGVAVLAARMIRAPQWRALPWTALAFTGWAGFSVAWSRWPETTALTWTLLAATTLVAIALAAMLTWRQLGLHDKPVFLLNVAGYWDPLIALIGHMAAEGFCGPDFPGFLTVESDPVALLDRVEALRG